MRRVVDSMLHLVQIAMLTALCVIVLLAVIVAVSMAFDGGYSGP